jgi:hypothetical protein
MSILLSFYECAHCGQVMACFYDCTDEAHFCNDKDRLECEQRAGTPRPDHQQGE